MNLSDIQTAYVDFDGTLVDSENCWIEAYRLACDGKSISASNYIVNAFNQITFEEWQKLVEEQLDIGAEKLLEYSKSAYTQRVPKESVLSIIRSLPKNCTKIIITREPSELVWYWLEFNSIGDFKAVITSGNERKASSYYEQSSLLLIDDNYKHCIAAKNANAIVIGVNDHHTSERKKQMQEICDLYIEN